MNKAVTLHPILYMKRFFLFVAIILTVSQLFAQTEESKETKQAADTAAKVEKAWKFDGVIGLNAAATGLLYWTGGGNNTASGLTYAKLHLLYHKDSIAWETNFDTEFGMTWIDDNDDQFKKSSDKIKISTKLGWEFKKNWYLTALGGFQSQYAIGRDYKKGKYDPVISKWLAPSYSTVSLGIDWKKSVNGCDFSVFIAPISGSIITVCVSDAMNKKYTEEYLDAMAESGEPIGDYKDFRQDLQSRYGTYKIVKDENGYPDLEWRNYRAEFGLSLKGTIAYKYKNLTLNTTLELFTPYKGKGYNLKEAFELAYPDEPYELFYTYSNLNRQFGRFDVDWDFLISYQLLKVLNVTFTTNLKYLNGTLITDDKGVKKERVQLKSVLGIGIGYSF